MPFKDTKKRKEYHHQWYLKNREMIIEKARINYGAKRKDEHCLALRKEWARKYYLENRDQFLKKSKEWKNENPQRVAVHIRKFRAKNPGIFNAKHRLWSKAHPEKTRLYHFRRRVCGFDKIEIETLEKVFSNNIDKYGIPTCIYCGMSLVDKKKVVDHLIPISKGGKNNYENLGVACFGCNAKKHTKTYDEFIETYPFAKKEKFDGGYFINF